MIGVDDYGARGDGKRDDTSGFRAALAEAGQRGGTAVLVPEGEYLIEGSLEVPAGVTLEGVFRSPQADAPGTGSTLLVTAGEGAADGAPFITMMRNASLVGVRIRYPLQVRRDPPVAYPWTVRGVDENCSIVNVSMVNPYQAVDFGTRPAGRHSIRGLYAQALRRGLLVDQCYDVGRAEDVHFWPFFDTLQSPLKDFMEREGVAFEIGRTDWQYLTNCFCIGYSIGFHFMATKAGEPNCLLTQCGSDIGPLAVRVDRCMKHAGLSFLNGQFMSTVETGPDNEGPVKFTACGFWPVERTGSLAVLRGRGHVTFLGCHFSAWATGEAEAPAIDAVGGGITVSGCEFLQGSGTQLRIGAAVDAALIYGNRLRGGQRIENHAGDRLQTGLNSAA